MDDTISFSRVRSPTFQTEEVMLLLTLVDKYKSILLNKSSCSAVTLKKDKVWSIIEKEFNKETKYIKRTKDVLRTKWENLKRSTRKMSLDKDSEVGISLNKIVESVHNNENEISADMEAIDDNIDWSDNNNINKEDDSDEDEALNRVNRIPSQFLPSECQLLLDCVKKEKDIIFYRTPRLKRYQAWMRICDSFNKQSPTQRTMRELNAKFNTMKSTALKMNVKKMFSFKSSKYDKMNGVDSSNDKYTPPEIKVEIGYSDIEMDPNIDERAVELNNANDFGLPSCDPLSGNVNGSDSDLGSMNTTDNKEEEKLKLELLNYKLETAKLERQRIQEAYKSERLQQALLSIETSMRLRTARLEMLSAEAKFPNSHPALVYTNEERKAQDYINKFKQDL